MSEPLRIALIAEGLTDQIIIEAALRSLLTPLLPQDFILIRLQPEETRPKTGTGWGGVLRWCQGFASRGASCLEDDPTLESYDFFILHIDADVAFCRYDQVSNEIAQRAQKQNWPTLPCSKPCPPVDGNVDTMRQCLLAWLEMNQIGPKTLFCIPSMTIDAWLASIALAPGHKLRNGIECNRNLSAQMKALPQNERVEKTKQSYLKYSGKITKEWIRVCQLCTQAERFSNAIRKITQPTASCP